MNGVGDGRYELEFGSSILTRRGGTDANAPESPRKARWRDRHDGIFGPHFLEYSGKVRQVHAGGDKALHMDTVFPDSLMCFIVVPPISIVHGKIFHGVPINNKG